MDTGKYEVEVLYGESEIRTEFTDYDQALAEWIKQVTEYARNAGDPTEVALHDLKHNMTIHTAKLGA